jgi:hypothetical protein
MKSAFALFILSTPFLFCNCTNNNTAVRCPVAKVTELHQSFNKAENKTDVRTVHVFVALCDNKYQGIVPVGKAIGNGQDPDNNLYWGCDNGVRTYFMKKSSDWVLLKKEKKFSDTIMERLLFKHKTENVFLLADAYDGRYIKQATNDFLQAANTVEDQAVVYNKDTLLFGGVSDLVSYIGHDGLMAFTLPVAASATAGKKKDAIILACYSQYYFQPHLKNSGAYPLLWTSNLMAPEAYTLHDALAMWVKRKDNDQVRLAAAKAYSKFQKCSLKAAQNLLISGWR